jgi:hypothetical protein
MQPRIPGFTALTSFLLLAASDLVLAQITAPDCSLTWDWVWLFVSVGGFDGLTVDT